MGVMELQPVRGICAELADWLHCVRYKQQGKEGKLKRVKEESKEEESKGQAQRMDSIFGKLCGLLRFFNLVWSFCRRH